MSAGPISPWRRAARKFVRNPLGIAGSLIMLVYIAAAIAPGLIAPYAANKTFRRDVLKGPSQYHLFGTDPIGRDIFSRVVYATSVALRVGLIAVLVGVAIGSLSGFYAAFRGGRLGQLIMRFWEGVFAIPAVLLGITIATATGPGLTAITLSVGIAAAPALARVAYGSGLQQMNIGYIEAAGALGVRPRRIFLGHLLPNSLGPVIVQAALFMGVAVLIEAGLSFLGVGIQQPAPSWGGMLSDSQRYIAKAWWYGVFPGLAIAGMVLSLNMIADAARDALDPRS